MASEKGHNYFIGEGNKIGYLPTEFGENQSIEEKKADRFREVVDEYYSFINDYPESENRKEADNIFKIAQRYVKE